MLARVGSRVVFHRFAATLALLFVLIAGAGCDSSAPSSAPHEGTDGIVLRVMSDTLGRAAQVDLALGREFEKQTGIKVDFYGLEMSSSERLTLYLQVLGSRSPEIDAMIVDIIWPPMVADHLVDLSAVPGLKVDEFFPNIVEKLMVGGQLVALPYFSDVGLVYYRTDLLAAYGFDKPPETWDELANVARVIQQGERAKGNNEFWGFVFDAKGQEGLTCDGLEWQMAETGLSMVDEDGQPLVTDPGVVATFARARSWIGDIVPPEALSYDVPMAVKQFQAGNAAFLRSWMFAWDWCQERESVIKDKVAIAPTPRGKHSAVAILGGWNWAIPRYSRHQEAAKKFVLFMTSAESQAMRARMMGSPPTRPAVYDREDVRKGRPHFDAIRHALMAGRHRPSAQLGHLYSELSANYYTSLSDILQGKVSPEDGAAAMNQFMQDSLAE